MLFCFFYGHFFFKLYFNFFSWSFKIANFICFHKEHANFDFVFYIFLRPVQYFLPPPRAPTPSSAPTGYFMSKTGLGVQFSLASTVP